MEDNFVSKSCTGIVMFTDFFSIDCENLTLGFQYPETATHLCFILALQLYGVTIWPSFVAVWPGFVAHRPGFVAI